MFYICCNNRKYLTAQVSRATAAITLNTILRKHLCEFAFFYMNIRVYRKDKEKRERERSEQTSVSAVSDLFQTVVMAASACLWQQGRSLFSTAASTTQKILVMPITGLQSNLASSVSFIQGYWRLICFLCQRYAMVSVQFARYFKITLYITVKLIDPSMLTLFNCIQETLERERIIGTTIFCTLLTKLLTTPPKIMQAKMNPNINHPLIWTLTSAHRATTMFYAKL